jgi:hypothetical protein
MSFRYALHTVDGDDAGEFHVAVPNWSVGEMFMTGGRPASAHRQYPAARRRTPGAVFDAAWMIEPVE